MKLEVTQTTKDTINEMINSKSIIQEWDAWNRGRRYKGTKTEAFEELVKKCLTPSRYIVDIISGEIELVTKQEKKYIVILPKIHNTGGCYWRYVYIDKDGDINTTDNTNEVDTFTNKELLTLPKWAQNLAKEVD